MKKNRGYYEKLVRFGTKEVKLFSLDGLTWSSTKSELKEIAQRQEMRAEGITSKLVPEEEGADKTTPAKKAKAAPKKRVSKAVKKKKTKKSKKAA